LKEESAISGTGTADSSSPQEHSGFRSAEFERAASVVTQQQTATVRYIFLQRNVETGVSFGVRYVLLYNRPIFASYGHPAATIEELHIA
jgi:hypothetical protein